MTRSLLLEIARCPNVAACRTDPTRQCREIVDVQAGWPVHQLPEPWNGDLEHAPILFVSSNPAIRQDEDYPDASWTDDQIVDFFEHRYSGGRKAWMVDTRGLRKDGTRAERANPFLSSARKTAERLLERPVLPGIDYVVTEVVHCKSEAERGVASAASECARRYLNRIIAASGARVIVVFGDRARVEFGDRPDGLHGLIELGGRSRMIVCLPHPNARKERRIDKVLGTVGMERAQAVLQ